MLNKLYKYLAIAGTLALSLMYALLQKRKADELDDDNQELQNNYDNINNQIDAGIKRRKQADEAIASIKPGATVADINQRMRDFNKRSRN